MLRGCFSFSFCLHAAGNKFSLVNLEIAGLSNSLTRAEKLYPEQDALFGSRLVLVRPGRVLTSRK